MQLRLHLLVPPLAALALLACGNDDGGFVADGGSGGFPDAMSGDGGTGDGSSNCDVTPSFHDLYSKLIGTVTCSPSGACHASMPDININGSLQMSGGEAQARTNLLGMTANLMGKGTYSHRVVPGNPNQSYLYNKLSSVAPVGGSSMPLGSMLPPCEVEAFRQWIQNGANMD
jgi:hypothetical protein